MPGYFRSLPYRRLVCLLLAASQLMLLPDQPQIHEQGRTVPLARLFPEHEQSLTQ